MIPNGPYMDMHTHILPGLDDGSDSMDRTRNMLRQAYEEGIRVIVATPHFGIRNAGFKLSEAEAVLAETQRVADEITPGLKLVLGNELFYTDGIVESLKRGESKTIGGSRYALVEFSTRDPLDKIEKCIREFTWNGYIPLIAHLERYRCLEGDIEAVRSLVRQGAVIQINCRSFMGGNNSSIVSSIVTGGSAGATSGIGNTGLSAGSGRHAAGAEGAMHGASTAAGMSNAGGTAGSAAGTSAQESKSRFAFRLFGRKAGSGNEGKTQGFFLEEKTDWARQLLGAGLVHLIASDCHDDELRRPVYRSALEAMEGYASEQALQDIAKTNVVKLIRNQKIV